jgi:hypothetical protein
VTAARSKVGMEWKHLYSTSPASNQSSQRNLD